MRCGIVRREPREDTVDGMGVSAAASENIRQSTAELHQFRVREIQEAAHDAALQDEALALEEVHLEKLIDVLREFSGLKDSPAKSLVEQARQV